MRLSVRYAPGSDMVVQIAALLSLPAILLAVVYDKPVYLIVLVLIAVLPLLIFVRQTIVWLFLASFFWGRFLPDTSYIGVTLSDILFLPLLAAYGARFIFTQDKSFSFQPQKKIMIALVLLFLWSVVSFVANAYHYKGIQIIISLWLLMKCAQLAVIFWIAQDAFSGIPQRNILGLFMVLCAIQIPVTSWQYFFQTSGAMLEAREMVIGTLTYHHSMIGTMMLFPIPVCLAYALREKRRMIQTLLIALLCAFVYVIMISGSRSTLFSLPFAIGAWVIFEIRKRPLQASVVIGMGILFSAILALTPLLRILMHKFLTLETGVIDISTISRLYIWEGAVAHFLSMNIWEKMVGVGIGAYRTIPYDFVLWASSRNISGAHSNLLHVLLETGIVGLMLFGYLFFEILRALWKKARTSLLASAYFYLTIMLLASGISQETFWFQKAFGSFWLFYITFLAVVLNLDENKDRILSPALNNKGAI